MEQSSCLLPHLQESSAGLFILYDFFTNLTSKISHGDYFSLVNQINSRVAFRHIKLHESLYKITKSMYSFSFCKTPVSLINKCQSIPDKMCMNMILPWKHDIMQVWIATRLVEIWPRSFTQRILLGIDIDRFNYTLMDEWILVGVNDIKFHVPTYRWSAYYRYEIITASGSQIAVIGEGQNHCMGYYRRGGKFPLNFSLKSIPTDFPSDNTFTVGTPKHFSPITK